MNTNPRAIRVLCYGDSNTKGTVPNTDGTQRYPVSVRWTGVLQEKLGTSYEVIEEGLSARTTVVDDNKRYGRNGKTFLPVILESHLPLDIVILALGTNDLKERYRRSLEQVKEGVEGLLKIVKEISTNSRIILLAPTFIDESVLGVETNYKGAEKLSRQLGPIYKSLAGKYGTDLLDLAEIVTPSKKDGLHLDPDAHQKIAESLCTLIQK